MGGTGQHYCTLRHCIFLVIKTSSYPHHPVGPPPPPSSLLPRWPICVPPPTMPASPWSSDSQCSATLQPAR